MQQWTKVCLVTTAEIANEKGCEFSIYGVGNPNIANGLGL